VKPILIMGNGPSLAQVDFPRVAIDTFGMNGAYRYYPELGWYPTFWGCFDTIVARNHAEGFRAFIADPRTATCRTFCFDRVTDHPKLNVLQPMRYGVHPFGRRGPGGIYLDKGNTGANCCQMALDMGYTRLILVGVDCSYVPVVDGAKQTAADRLRMQRTPAENPNYAWRDYQRAGDEFHPPNTDAYHWMAWRNLRAFALRHPEIEVINCGGERSAIDYFARRTLETAGVYGGNES